MLILIVYGTTEGHTRDLSEYLARCLREAGRQVDVRDAASAADDLNPSDYEAVLVAASLHVGRYQPAVVEFARIHHEDLNTTPSAFVSVSLSAAGVNPHDWEGLEQCLTRFLHETMWRPKAIHHAAGAIRYSQYDFFKRVAINFIARQHGQATVTSRDYDLTDYPALKTFAQKKFRISLAQWSLHKAIFARMTTNLEFPRIAREQFGIEGLEFVNGLWEAPTQDYVRELKQNMDKTGTKGVLIMCDGEGLMGHSNKAERMRAARNHYKWVDIAAELGCHAIRTNMYPDKQPTAPAEIDAFIGCCSESFANLCEYAKPMNISVIIENHGGVSSNPDVVSRLMKKVSLPNFGTLPDFGNFPKEIDKYDAVRKLMPFAKGVSFKCYDFGADGNETTIDMHRMMKIVDEAGYHGWVGIEYEGERLTEFEGIQAAKRFLERVG